MPYRKEIYDWLLTEKRKKTQELKTITPEALIHLVEDEKND